MQNKIAKIGRMNGRICEFALPIKATVEDLLTAAGETLKKGETITLDGETVDSDYDFDAGDEFVIVPSTTGA
jgi:hypothetical protein